MKAASHALEIDTAQDDFRALALEASLQEFLRDAFLDPATQLQELGLALRRCCFEWPVEIIQGAGADGATNLRLPVHHRKEHDHPVEVVFLICALCECHVALLFVQRRIAEKALYFSVGHGTERFDLAEAIFIGGMRSCHEGPTHFRAVPAGFDAEPGRFFRLNVTR